ncbi:ATP-binding protein [Flaviflexus salsibiostraticola]|uniref:ATP-binding protein n=1 Tax=Flaviflexus salsibiostraticola TaxID=1282737 RepID=A0A3Q8WTK9_9ACTO|nr:ATP-binding protein [Flaviflexus salsibiostraticola]AZN29672.1 ATP-binding protein [Flaviflexus salsibiostraticola]
MERYPLRRPQSGRIVTGVCQGISDHIGVNVWIIRGVFALLGLARFAGVLIYMWLTIAVPASDDVPDRVEPRFAPTPRTRLLSFAVLAVVAAIGLVVFQSLITISIGVVISLACLVAGAALAWTNIGGSSVRVQLIRLLSGISLLVIGVLIFAVRDEDPQTMVTSVVVALSVLVIAAFAMWPAVARMLGELDAARRESASEAARADIAAHLHDSVLQTLTLIRNAASDPAAVTRLARVQERQLRTWLYGADRDESSLPDAFRTMIGEVEDLYGVEVDFVAVGDGERDEHSRALLAASREAVVNAVRHGAAPISVYAEFSKDATDVFIRDHGEGFDIEAVPDDRHGVRDSILARTHRHGGAATIRGRSPGTEVHIRIPRGHI